MMDLEMDKIEHRAVIKYLYKKGLSSKEIHLEMTNTLEDSAPGYSTVKKWVADFKRGRESLTDGARSGRPLSATTQENINKIHDMIVNNRQITNKELAEAVGISSERVSNIMKTELQHVTNICKNLGFGCAFSKICRCLNLLICIGFVGKAGRSVLKAIVFALIISGPIHNILLNGKEIVRVFSCSTILTYNLTKVRFDLMSKPLHNVLMDFKNNISNIKETLKEFEYILEPIIYEIEENDNIVLPTEKWSNEYLNNKSSHKENGKHHIKCQNSTIDEITCYRMFYEEKLKRRCDLQLQQGQQKCKMSFLNAYDNCYNKLPTVINTLLCWPMKISYVCNLADSFGMSKEKLCNSSKLVNSDFAEKYVELKEIKKKLLTNIDKTYINVTTVKEKIIPGLVSAKQVVNNVYREFIQKKTRFDYFMDIIKQILALIIIKVFINSIRYYYRYMMNIEFDNIYITTYFNEIDEQRANRELRNLIPLKKVERKKLIDSNKKKLFEYAQFLGHIIKLLLQLLTTTCFILLDHIIYESLRLVRKHSKIDYFQEGEHIVNIKVKGTGVIAGILRSTLEKFNIDEKIQAFATNKECLPQPHKTANWEYYKIYGIFIIILIQIYNEPYIQRLRSLICGYFHPKREKRRIKYLYKKLLHRRKALYNIMSYTINEHISNPTNKELQFDSIIKLIYWYPKIFGWLRMFPFGRRKCILCDEIEPKHTDLLYTNGEQFIYCTSENCNIVHCKECWYEIKQVCLGCKRIWEQYYQDDDYLSYCYSSSDNNDETD